MYVLIFKTSIDQQMLTPIISKEKIIFISLITGLCEQLEMLQPANIVKRTAQTL